MTVMRAFLHPTGSRIRIRAANFPQDPSLLGREGVVVKTSESRTGYYAVVLDGEDRFRSFAEAELERVEP
ncbi:MAG: hypothetical protein WEA09_03370 [Gemmatimonadota bacterium]